MEVCAGHRLGLIATPVGWQFLRDYQKQRILTFLNQKLIPWAGYHYSVEIALGSGGFWGKDAGNPRPLNFSTEMQTDFIFTMLAEEFGLVGGLGLLALCLAATIWGDHRYAGKCHLAVWWRLA